MSSSRELVDPAPLLREIDEQILMLQVSEVARMFGIPPHMLMDTEKSETRRRSERRAWAVWDRKRRARRKR